MELSELSPGNSDKCYNLNLDMDAKRKCNTIKLILIYTQYVGTIFIYCEAIAKAIAVKEWDN